MAYIGEIMNQCPAHMFDFKSTFAVVVTGDRWNPCGHMLLNTGGDSGMYFHFTTDGPTIRGYPRFMTADQYRRYLRENGKKEEKRYKVTLPKPEAAMQELEQSLSQQRTWLVFPHNCVTFVEDIVKAGGSDAGQYLNCPRLENFQ